MTEPDQNAYHDSTPIADSSGFVTEKPEDNLPFLPPSSDPPPAVYISYQTFTYFQYLAPLVLIALVSFLFQLFIATKGKVRAPQRLVDFAKSNPRLTPQIVTVLATALTLTMKWTFSGAALLLAKKRSLNQARTISELELYGSFKNISILWDWNKRKRDMFLTVAPVLICALLTSGFVTLFNPLPITMVSQLPNNRELSLALVPGVCADWYNKSVISLVSTNGGGCTWVHQNETEVDYSTCPAGHEDIVDIAKLAIHFDPLKKTSNHYQRYPPMLSRLNYTRVVGTTAGVLITGPEGAQRFGFQSLAPITEGSSYSLKLQGLWANVSCSYSEDKNSSLTVEWGPARDSSGSREYKVSCPNSPPHRTGIYSPSTGNPNLNFVERCPSEEGTTAIYFRLFKGGIENHRELEDFLACKYTLDLAGVDAELDPTLRAFKLTKTPPTAGSATKLARPVAEELTNRLIFHFRQYVISSAIWVRYLYCHKTCRVTGIEAAIRGILEYEMSRLRLSLEVAPFAYDRPSIPEECLTDVQGVLFERTIGWSSQLSTHLGLIPFAVFAALSFTTMMLAMIAPGRVPAFDPTNPVSLIAAAGSGAVEFPERKGDSPSVCDPLDELVLNTKVAYTQLENGWGFTSGVTGRKVLPV